MARDHSDIEAKVKIREKVIVMMGDERIRVLDLYAGQGLMKKLVWDKVAEAYLGLEKKYSRGDCWRGDNRLLLERAMKQNDWNVFDLDAYGNPWSIAGEILKIKAVLHHKDTKVTKVHKEEKIFKPQFLQIKNEIKELCEPSCPLCLCGEKRPSLGFALTCGMGRALRAGGSRYIREVAGLAGIDKPRLLRRYYDQIISCIMESWAREGWEVQEAYRLPSRYSPDVVYWAIKMGSGLDLGLKK